MIGPWKPDALRPSRPACSCSSSPCRSRFFPWSAAASSTSRCSSLRSAPCSSGSRGSARPSDRPSRARVGAASPSRPPSRHRPGREPHRDGSPFRRPDAGLPGRPGRRRPCLPEPLLARARRDGPWGGAGPRGRRCDVPPRAELLEAVARRESFLGSTFGNPVLLAGLLAASVPARLGRAWAVNRVPPCGLRAGSRVRRGAQRLVLPLVAFAASRWFVRPHGDGSPSPPVSSWQRSRSGPSPPPRSSGIAPINRFTAIESVRDARGERQRLAVYRCASGRSPTGPSSDGALRTSGASSFRPAPDQLNVRRPLLGRRARPPDRARGDLGRGGVGRVRLVCDPSRVANAPPRSRVMAAAAAVTLIAYTLFDPGRHALPVLFCSPARPPVGGAVSSAHPRPPRPADGRCGPDSPRGFEPRRCRAGGVDRGGRAEPRTIGPGGWA